MAEIFAEIKRIPPVTRFLVLSSLGVTVPAIVGFVPMHKWLFITPLIFRKLELWRVYTSLFFGTTGISYLFHLVMLYQSSNGLETTHYERRSSDYAWQLFLASLGVIALSRPFGSVAHDHAFLCCLTYTMCALSPPGAQTSFMGLIPIPLKYFPYALLIMDALSGRASECLTGMIVGHLWWWFVWGAGTGAGMEQGMFAGLARTPRWLRDWFGERERDQRATNRDGYQVHAPRQDARTAGHRWGSGQRLGSQ